MWRMRRGSGEAQAEDLDVEVNRVAGQISLEPPPVKVFDDQTGIGRQRICSRVQWVLLQERLVTVFSPVGLNEDAIDLLEVHDAVLIVTA
jgi:hypothetical protein